VKGIRVLVTAYAGYRGEEEPRSFILDGRKIVVIRIVERWVEQTADSGNRRRCFRVTGSDEHTHLLCCHEPANDWYLE
jgi:hypothetical protein